MNRTFTKAEREKILFGLARAYDLEEDEINETRKTIPNYSNKSLIEFASICKKLANLWGYDFLRGKQC